MFNLTTLAWEEERGFYALEAYAATYQNATEFLSVNIHAKFINYIA